MFKNIYVEKEVSDLPQTISIIERFKNAEISFIEKIDEYFGVVKKDYLQKRTNLNLFLGNKRGQLIKEAPEAYGLSGEKHFYFIHAFNCIYECNYCYLQGYFNSPDIVLFLNHSDIIEQMDITVSKNPSAWFHAGEFSDSLALSHITNELKTYFDFFKINKNAKLELRTKSANIRALKDLEPLDNVYISFSLSPNDKIKANDLKTPSLDHRLLAMKELQKKGYKLAIHFDPIIYEDDIISAYQELIEHISSYISLDHICYISLGVVRFTKDVYHQVKKNYPKSEYFKSELILDNSNLVRYPRPMRLWLLNKIKELLVIKKVPDDKIYLCME